ncbi:MAG TPA: hypothetical protein EYP53_02865 [Candidatus Latescibacteria bacterium]|nr:hypothetical protein [Candidatus Latescibacterota bacterium]
MEHLYAGVGVVDITPPLGVELAGYGYYLSRRCDGVKDHLLSKALILDDGIERVALVANDLLGLNSKTVQRVREMVCNTIGIQPDHILLSCTHTHSGPATVWLRGCGEIDEDYLTGLPHRIVKAIKLASDRMVKAEIRIGSSRLNGFSYNRSEKQGRVDTEVGVLRVDTTNGDPLAILVNFSTHPVVMRASSTMVSCDYPGIAADAVEATLHGSRMLFLQGACGDVNPLSVHSGELEEAGGLLADGVLSAQKRMERMEDLSLASEVQQIDLPLEIPDKEEILHALEENRVRTGTLDPESSEGREMRLHLEALKDLLAQLHEGPPSGVKAELQAVKIGGLLIACTPSELFVDFGLEIKSRSPAKRTFVVGYANGLVGYIPDKANFKRGGYESRIVPLLFDRFPFVQNVGEIMVAEMMTLIDQVWGS